jgi:hypothetical protein
VLRHTMLKYTVERSVRSPCYQSVVREGGFLGRGGGSPSWNFHSFDGAGMEQRTFMPLESSPFASESGLALLSIPPAQNEMVHAETSTLNLGLV